MALATASGYFCSKRIVRSHHPLQLGKLADHQGEEIGLGEDGGALGIVGIGTNQRRDLLTSRYYGCTRSY